METCTGGRIERDHSESDRRESLHHQRRIREQRLTSEPDETEKAATDEQGKRMGDAQPLCECHGDYTDEQHQCDIEHEEGGSDHRKILKERNISAFLVFAGMDAHHWLDIT